MGEPIKLLNPDASIFNNRSKLYKDGIEVEKGVVLTEDFMNQNEELLLYYWQLFCVYPDLYLDLITPEHSNFELYPYQRIFLRACMRYTNVFITAARATSKSFLSVLVKYLQCVFLPNHRGSIVAPNVSQAAKITKQKVQEIWSIWPLLKKELEPYGNDVHANFSKDSVKLFFKNGSTLEVVGALNSSRGLRTHATFLDEVRDSDGDMIQEVILPQMNVARRTFTGTVNPYEKINTQVICGTSAGTKSSFAYGQLIDMFEKCIIDPNSNFCMGLDYRIPAQHGLIDRSFVEGLKLSSNYDETTFAAEYMGSWQGSSDESWYNYDRITKYRKIKNPEWTQKFKDDSNVFYLLSVDVGRLNDQTVVCVFRVNVKDDKYFATLVNIDVLGTTPETKQFSIQMREIKKIIEIYNPREVVIDGNGIGVAMMDLAIQEQHDENGKVLPAYGFKNNDDYKKIQPKDAQQLFYCIKGNAKLNSQIHGNAYTRLNSGLVRFLITEQEARTKLLSTKVGMKMDPQKRAMRLKPHVLTTKLFEEMGNLRLKRTGLDISLEQINTRFHDDKYHAMAYGLWRIKELEEEAGKKRRRSSLLNGKNLVFFTGGQI